MYEGLERAIFAEICGCCVNDMSALWAAKKAVEMFVRVIETEKADKKNAPYVVGSCLHGCDSVDKAILIAVGAHFDQKDKAGEPYILHPLRVMIKYDLLKEEEKIVAVLHDVLEDTVVTALDLVKGGFSSVVMDALCCITRNKGEDYSVYLRRVKSNDIAKRVKVADLLDNLNPVRLDKF